mmetsp:Transcript_22705/g.57845  ORF Transcript_22705/g.57845 Transcript_22705/m.57845 type:complete len:281 (+) Transcript_22705:152-994(+)
MGMDGRLAFSLVDWLSPSPRKETLRLPVRGVDVDDSAVDGRAGCSSFFSLFSREVDGRLATVGMPLTERFACFFASREAPPRLGLALSPSPAPPPFPPSLFTLASFFGLEGRSSMESIDADRVNREGGASGEGRVSLLGGGRFGSVPPTISDSCRFIGVFCTAAPILLSRGPAVRGRFSCLPLIGKGEIGSARLFSTTCLSEGTAPCHSSFISPCSSRTFCCSSSMPIMRAASSKNSLSCSSRACRRPCASDSSDFNRDSSKSVPSAAVPCRVDSSFFKF